MKLINSLMILLFAIIMGSQIEAHAQATEVRVTEPGPISVPKGKPYTVDEVRKAILSSAMRREWAIDGEAPGSIRIKLERRDFWIVMNIIYDTESYSIKYVNSEGLRYEKGTGIANACPVGLPSCTGPAYQQYATIHPSYARWMKGLVDSINSELAILHL